MSTHVNAICRSGYQQLRVIGHIRPYITPDTLTTVTLCCLGYRVHLWTNSRFSSTVQRGSFSGSRKGRILLHLWYLYTGSLYGCVSILRSSSSLLNVWGVMVPVTYQLSSIIMPQSGPSGRLETRASKWDLRGLSLGRGLSVPLVQSYGTNSPQLFAMNRAWSNSSVI